MDLQTFFYLNSRSSTKKNTNSVKKYWKPACMHVKILKKSVKNFIQKSLNNKDTCIVETN